MSSRQGVVLMEDLLNQAEAKARAVVAKNPVPDSDIHKIALGAIKFADFVNDRATSMLFDWQAVFALTGKSGPYVQYAAVRIGKIIEKNTGFEVVDYQAYDFEAERALLKLLLDYPAVVKRAAAKLEPHAIAMFLLDLAKVLNRYYEKTPVSTADDMAKSARLATLKKARQVITHGLDLLGIDVPSRM
jgi:arginyl-tRNA synthetase